jgi:aminoglycoside phosphotransferase (APT) family kinase protein
VIPAEVLARIPGCEAGRPPLDVQPLPGGRGCNLVLRVDTPQGRFVWRQRQAPIDRPGSRAADELLAQRAAAAAGFAPAIIAAEPQGHWLLMEFVDAPQWSSERLQSPAGIDTIAQRLAGLHTLAVPAGLVEVDAGQIARGYLAQLLPVAPREAVDLEPLLARIETLGRRLSNNGASLAMNHGDLAVTNMLGNAPLLVDWEYTQLADPSWDLACLFGYYPGLDAMAPRLLDSYGLKSGDRDRLALQRERFELLNRLWERVAAHGAG